MSELVHDAADRVQDLLRKTWDRIQTVSSGRRSEAERWLVVTIDRPEATVVPGGQLPAMLAAFADAIEVDVRPAPGARGTEVAVRPTGRPSPAATDAADQQPDELRRTLRQVLRQLKQLVEVGEVLIAEPRPHGVRPATLGGKLVDAAERKADRGGVL
jgi:hypothetical protein